MKEELSKLMKKIKFLIGAGVVAYEVYEMIKRNQEKKAFEEAELELERLEKRFAVSKGQHKFPVKFSDINDRRRHFRRSF